MKAIKYFSFIVFLSVLSCNNETGTDKILAQSKHLNIGDETYAVVIAVEDYENMTPWDGDLNYTIDDAVKFTKFLMSKKGGNVPKENIYLLTNEKARKANILKYTKKMFLRASKNDKVIFYFSGHGAEGSFLPYDVTSFGDNLLYFSEVKQLFRSASSRTKLLFADACHSGSLRESKSKQLKKALSKAKNSSKINDHNIAVMLSSRSEETSLEDKINKQGVFSYYLIKGLSGHADKDRNMQVTIKELFYFVSERTAARAKKIRPGHYQHPVLFGKFDLDMVVANLN